jgi:geranylgeranyl diphosphate synthase type II
MKRFEADLQLIEKAVQGVAHKSQPASLYDPVSYLTGLGGKRIRPLLCLLGARLFGGNVDQVLPAAVAVELFHNFSLMHDDIMDNADVRRGQPTVHSRWSPSQAILSGDVTLVLAYEELLKIPVEIREKVIHLFNQTAIEVCEGQQFDLDFEKRADVSEEEYLNMIKLKTSVLLACSVTMGAMIAGANEEQIEKVYDYGLHIGLSFQLRDDLLDTFGDESFGKRIGGDILADKKTYLLIRSLRKAGEAERAILNTHVGVKTQDPEVKVSEVKGVMERLEVADETQALATKHYEIGMAALNVLTDQGIDTGDLSYLANLMLERSK